MAESTNSVRCADCALLFLQPAAPRQTRTARLEELLLGNHPPLDVEIPGFRSGMDDARAALQDLDAKIAQAKELLDDLLSAREQAKSHLEDAKSILHPMRSIPSELFKVEIFNHCLPKVDNLSSTDALHPRQAPWLLTRICRRWRELAINSPRLWSRLLIDFGMPAGCKADLWYAFRASLFIERSRGLPMSIYLSSLKPIPNHWLAVLEKGIPNCRFLSVGVPRSSLQCLLERVFSHLQTLVVLSYHWQHPDSDLGAYKPLRAPVLRELEVLSDESWEDVEAASLPWSQITSVRNFWAFDVFALNRLRMMTNLEDLSVLVDDSESEIDDPIPDIIVLPKLRRLTILENYIAGSGQQFFAALQIPALVELILEFPEDEVILFPTISSTSPLGNLTRLDISCNMHAHEENIQHLMDFLALTHRVEWLRIRDHSMTFHFVDGLNVSDGDFVLLPCLLFLDIGDCRCAGAEFDDINPIIDMLQSRLPRYASEEGEGAEQQSLVTSGVVANRADCNHLRTVHLSRPVYVNMRDQWSNTFVEMSRKVKLVCGVA